MFIEQTERFAIWRELHIIKDLTKMQEDFRKYLKIGKHVGNLIATAADVEFKVFQEPVKKFSLKKISQGGSEEQNALHALHSKFLAPIKGELAYLRNTIHILQSTDIMCIEINI